VLDGGLVGEAPPGTRPERWRFPRRNRLVAALAAVIVVVEAPRRSGALVTARLGAEQGRDVLAVPGSVHWPLSAGCLDLLQRGEAGLVRSAADVLAVLGDRVPSRSTARSSGGGARATHEPDLVDPREARLWRLLEERDHQGEDELARRCGLDVLAVTALLAAWEIDGFVQRVPGAGVRRRS
jgi:DNA processing protein